MAGKIDDQIKQITDLGYKNASLILTKLRKKLDVLAEELLKKETIESEDFLKLMGPKKALVIDKA
jgi:ATP-dependent Zn protease